MVECQYKLSIRFKDGEVDRSAKLLGHIIEEGDEALNCYRFF